MTDRGTDSKTNEGKPDKSTSGVKNKGRGREIPERGSTTANGGSTTTPAGKKGNALGEGGGGGGVGGGGGGTGVGTGQKGSTVRDVGSGSPAAVTDTTNRTTTGNNLSKDNSQGTTTLNKSTQSQPADLSQPSAGQSAGTPPQGQQQQQQQQSQIQSQQTTLASPSQTNQPSITTPQQPSGQQKNPPQNPPASPSQQSPTSKDKPPERDSPLIGALENMLNTDLNGNNMKNNIPIDKPQQPTKPEPKQEEEKKPESQKVYNTAELQDQQARQQPEQQNEQGKSNESEINDVLNDAGRATNTKLKPGDGMSLAQRRAAARENAGKDATAPSNPPKPKGQGQSSHPLPPH
ncbi:hypothetical protein FACS1894152_5080 [Bacilli bacterium]|nr:hypothetical protein FACS1894152_5080 [Bacilli bacterium]